MKIINVCSSYPPAWKAGGVPIMSHALTKGIQNLGNEVITVTSNANMGEPLPVEINRTIHRDGVPTIYLDRFTSRVSYFQNLKSTLENHAQGADLIVSRGTWEVENVAVRQIGQRYNVPYVLFVDGMLDPWAWNYKAWKKRPYWYLIEKLNYSQSSAIVAMHTIEKVQIKSKVPQANVIIVPSGTTMPSENNKVLKSDLEAKYPELRARRWILSLSRIHEKKGIDILMQGFAQAADNLPPTQLIICGAGEESYIQSLKQLAQKLGISEKITWAGLVVEDEKDAFLRYSDIFTLISHSEGLPMAILESMAYGLPMLLSHHCNTPFIAEEGAGYCINPIPDDVAAGLQGILKEVKVQKNMRSAGLRLAQGAYSWANISERFVAECVTLLGRRVHESSSYPV